MRAREPDVQAHLERDGLRIAYETFNDAAADRAGRRCCSCRSTRACTAGRGRPRCRTCPSTTACHHRPAGQRPLRPTHGPRGVRRPRVRRRHGGRDGPAGVDRAVLVGICMSAWQAMLVASLHAERVRGVVAIGAVALRPHAAAAVPGRGRGSTSTRSCRRYEGWSMDNRHFMPEELAEFAAFFFDQMLCEPHSTKQLEDIVGWTGETTGQVQLAAGTAPVPRQHRGHRGAAARDHPAGAGDPRHRGPLPAPRSVQRLAEWTGGELLELEGRATCRWPGTRSRSTAPSRASWTGSRVRPPPPPPQRRYEAPPRALYLSSPDRARPRPARPRDRRRAARAAPRPGGRLADPVAGRGVPGAAGRAVHPASGSLASESAHVEAESGEHDLHAFQAIRRMDEVLVDNFHVFDDVVEREALRPRSATRPGTSTTSCTRTPQLKRAPFVWLTDFVGWLPMPDGGEREAALTADYNAEMVEHVARYPALRDRSVFVGDPDDVVDLPLAPACRRWRDWTEEHFAFAGYVMGERPDPVDREALRDAAGLRRRRRGLRGERRRVRGRRTSCCGGSSRRTTTRAARVPGLRIVRRHRPADRPGLARRAAGRRGARVRARPPPAPRRLRRRGGAGWAEHHDGADGARPTVPVLPARHHFEQQVHVRHRLERHRAGRALDYRDADPARIADALAAALAPRSTTCRCRRTAPPGRLSWCSRCSDPGSSTPAEGGPRAVGPAQRLEAPCCGARGRRGGRRASRR